MAGHEHKPTSPMGGVKAFSCPNCGGQVTLRAPGQTLAAACSHCSSVIDLSNENLRILQKAQDKITREPVIPIGTRGKMEGIEWEVIGFIERKVAGYEYFWEEYLLFNPWYGFRWLLNNHGHWGYASPMMDSPQYADGGNTAKYAGRKYKKFSRGGAQVNFVLGEFYWKVKRGDTVSTIDLVAPPYMLSYEKDQHGHNWTHTAYIEPEIVQKAFQIEKMPFRRRIGANQPNKAKESWKQVRLIYFAVLAIVIAMQVFFSARAEDKIALKGKNTFYKENHSYVSQPFTLGNGYKNVEIDFNATTLSQSWIYMEGYLHNKTLNKNFGFDVEWEFYSGFDSDGSWTEGSKRTSTILNRIPEGEYELVLDAKLPGNAEIVQFTLKRDVPFFTNFWMILIAISIFPILLLVRQYVFEKARWEEAD